VPQVYERPTLVPQEPKMKLMIIWLVVELLLDRDDES
jgi:hypothetical protein